jgi:hypothetical protein
MKLLPALSLVLLGGCAMTANALAANPFLSAADEKPVSAKFAGTEWGDEIGSKDLPLSAKVVTTRVAHAAWGDIFKISFEDIVSKAKPKRELRPVYYIVTDDEIVLLNEEDNMAAAKKLAAEAKAPAFEPGDVQGISKGTRKTSDTLTETNITVKGDLCTYMWSHNSGHFTTIKWQKGVGLIEYAQGYGASRDGFRLKRAGGAAKGKG